MKAKVADLRTLIQRLLDKSGESPTPKGFQKIADLVENENVSQRYLYDHIHNRIKEFDSEDVLNLREPSLNAVALYLGHGTFRDFVDSLKEKRDPQLETCIGSYYSYLRMNAKETVLLQSPVRIFYENGKYRLEQKGARNTFSGEIKSVNNCLFILLESEEGKSFYHTYKIGVIKAPQVLQGIFSGVSSSFDPIGGRVVLIRVSDDYTKLKTAQLKSATKDPNLKILFSYFKEYNTNNLALNRSISFTLRDLKD